MKIISLETDYYDSICYQYGFDATITFYRGKFDNPEIPQKFNNVIKSLTPRVRHVGKDTTIILTPIIFCNTLYVQELICSSELANPDYESYRNANSEIRYLTSEEMSKSTNKRSWYSSEMSFNELQRYDFTELHNILNLAYFSVNGAGNIDPHPHLGNLKFAKAVDPYSAAQTIEQFLSTHLTSVHKPPIEIDDKYRIAAHGFDKASFRKPKSTK